MALGQLLSGNERPKERCAENVGSVRTVFNSSHFLEIAFAHGLFTASEGVALPLQSVTRILLWSLKRAGSSIADDTGMVSVADGNRWMSIHRCMRQHQERLPDQELLIFDACRAGGRRAHSRPPRAAASHKARGASHAPLPGAWMYPPRTRGRLHPAARGMLSALHGSWR